MSPDRRSRSPATASSAAHSCRSFCEMAALPGRMNQECPAHRRSRAVRHITAMVVLSEVHALSSIRPLRSTDEHAFFAVTVPSGMHEAQTPARCDWMPAMLL